ncbi:MAG: hypothetical protein QS98_C0002G0045 [archaeon GW2011_AR3]|nr:MAG: hypothetical protein QS98_C0002G0045 [archaeon GW2011_AR3]MBS3109964.1 hypothetical protein [Candidatus Woesearchaeota archaeon]
MKAIATILMVALMLVGAVSAVDMTITPQLVHLDHTDSKDVVVCVTKADNSPYTNLDLYITSECQDLDNDEVCSVAENGNAAGIFSATVKTSPTDAAGCGEVTLATNAAPGGTFAYSVLSKNGAVDVDSEGALAYVPEFGVIAAMTVLGGAGYFIYKRRK